MKKIIIIFIILLMVVNTYRYFNNAGTVTDIFSFIDNFKINFSLSTIKIDKFNASITDLKEIIGTLSEYRFSNLYQKASDAAERVVNDPDANLPSNEVLRWIIKIGLSVVYMTSSLIFTNQSYLFKTFQMLIKALSIFYSFIEVVVYALFDIAFYLLKVLGYSAEYGGHRGGV